MRSNSSHIHSSWKGEPGLSSRHNLSRMFTFFHTFGLRPHSYPLASTHVVILPVFLNPGPGELFTEKSAEENVEILRRWCELLGQSCDIRRTSIFARPHLHETDSGRMNWDRMSKVFGKGKGLLNRESRQPTTTRRNKSWKF